MTDRHFDAATARCFVYTFKEGVLSKVGHDLKLAVTRFSLEVVAQPLAVSARFEAGSLRVVAAVAEGRDLPSALTASDRREIEGHVHDVLEARRWPWIEFRSTLAAPTSASSHRLEGLLTLHGVERAISLVARSGPVETVVETRLYQPDFGIKPYRALLGALRLQADLLVRVVVPLVP